MKGQRFERGQALVLIVLSVVAIFGFAALAVDMGRIYAERRRAQSAADSSALAAAYTVADSNAVTDQEVAAAVGQAMDTAFASALENGYERTITNSEGEVQQVEVKSPPDDWETSHYEECHCEYIQVKIHSFVNPIFMQFIGRGTSEITTISIARARLSQPISTYNAIHALLMPNESGDGIMVDGNFTLDIKNGNVRSNKNGVKDGGSGKLTLENGAIITNSGWTNTDGVSATLGIFTDLPLIVPVPPEPVCDPKVQTVPQGGTLAEGTYNGITLGPGDWKMKGMYCVNGDFKINGSANVKGDGIFIVLKGGSLSIDGNATVQWKRANNQLDKASKPNQWGGMLIYVVPTDNKLSGDVDLTGSSASSFMGTVFNPKGLCGYGGNSQFNTFTSFQLVCRQVKLHGTPNVGIDYHDDQGYRMPPIVELVK